MKYRLKLTWDGYSGYSTEMILYTITAIKHRNGIRCSPAINSKTARPSIYKQIPRRPMDITVTSWRAQWYLKSPTFREFTQPFVQGQIKETSKLRVTGFCEGHSPVTGELPSQRASNAENVSIWWRHHGYPFWRSSWNIPLTYHLSVEAIISMEIYIHVF